MININKIDLKISRCFLRRCYLDFMKMFYDEDFIKMFIIVTFTPFLYFQEWVVIGCTPAKVRGGFWNFGFLAEVKIFLISRGLSYGGVYFLGKGQFILRLFSHFEMQDFNNSKNFFLRRPHFQYSHFKI